ncbi:MAG: hypothetical protein Q6363_007525 [Candidatus Njordarchaeota archaeon]
MEIILILTSKIPMFLSNTLLQIIVLLDLLVILSIDITSLLLTITIEQPAIIGILSIAQNINDPTLLSLLITGLVIHVLIINNQLIANLI